MCLDMEHMEEIIAGIRLRHGPAGEGLSSGMDVLDIETDCFQARLLPGRGMGLHRVKSGKLVLGWKSPVRGPVNPAYIRLEEEGGTGWLRGFDEWLVRCGLFSHGAPSVDEVETPLGGKREILLPLHGRIANTPAQGLDFEETEDKRLKISGTVHETVVFGACLRLRSSLYVKRNSRVFTIVDEVTNVGGRRTEFELLYHLNFGPPILEKGAQLRAPFKWIHARDAVAAKGLERMSHFDGPTPGIHEQAFFTALNSREDGSTDLVLHNAAGDLGCRVSFNVKQLPCFTLWKYLASEEEGYVTGLEPSIGYPNPKPFERSKGRVPVLEPGESRTAQLEFELLESAAHVAQACERVDALEGEPESPPSDWFPG